jgi:hypothetical protein
MVSGSTRRFSGQQEGNGAISQHLHLKVAEQPFMQSTVFLSVQDNQIMPVANDPRQTLRNRRPGENVGRNSNSATPIALNQSFEFRKPSVQDNFAEFVACNIR